MNIGIDIDDTMSNSFEIMLADSQIYDIEEMKGTGDIKNLGSIPTYDQIENMYKWEEEALKKFWYKHFERVLREATPKQYVAETIKKLKEEGKMERQKKYKNCVKNSQKELRFENKFVIIAVHGSKNRRRGGLQ